MGIDIQNIDLKLNEFKPILSFWTGHSQTVLGHIVKSDDIQFKLTEEVLTLPDGDQLLLEYAVGTAPFTLSLYHGLGGDASADYIRRSANIAYELGWNIVLVNHRAASPKVFAKCSYHSGRGEDAEAVIEWCRRQFVNSKQVAVGFSMSGSILLNLLTERYGQKQPDVAVIVNAPLDLGKAAQLLTEGFSKIYDLRFYLKLKKIIQKKVDIVLPILAGTRTIDEAYTSKANGFVDAMDYYQKCSVKNFVDRIETPTFVLSSEDDPFIDVNDYKNAKWNKNVKLHLNQFGGHMGYFSKETDPKYGRRWLDHYLRSVFENIQTAKF